MAVNLTIAQAFGQDKPIRTSADEETQTHMLAVAKAVVDDYAGTSTPQAVSNEAAIRVMGWLNSAPMDGQISERDDSYSVRWAANMGPRALLLSGAQELLRPWHTEIERGVVI